MINLPKHLQTFFKTDSLPGLGPEQRAGRLTANEIDHATKNPLVRCVALIWHDDLEGSHEISQGIKSPDGSFLHGIMHRREPDYSNAKYWFNRAGEHPAFSEIALRAARTDAGRLIPVDKWDSFAMVDAVAQVAKHPESKDYRLLQEVQLIELEVLLERFTSQQS